MKFPRLFSILLAAGACITVCAAEATIVTEDRAFASVPFEKWLADGDQGKFHWSARMTAGELSNHQRLKAKVDLQVDGNDIAARRGHGYLVMLVQFEDADHRLYRSHGVLDLQQVTEAAAKSDVIYTQEAFVRPGDYQVSLVIFDTQTGDHSALQRKIHANPMRNDPFPSAWDHLPAVEFTGNNEAPDSWYLPAVTGKLDLMLHTRKPVSIEVLVNASPAATATTAQTGRISNRSLVDLLPALKVISQVKVENGSERVELVDLTRQTVLFDQSLADGAAGLDWPEMRAALMQADPNKIDARSLAQRRGNAQFFISRVKHRLALDEATPKADSPVKVGIILSGLMSFESGEDRHPIEGAAGFGGKLFYVRYHAAPPLTVEPTLPELMRSRRGIGTPLPPLRQPVQEPLDGMVNLMKPLQPHVFDVYSPEQFRKALNTILDEISRL